MDRIAALRTVEEALSAFEAGEIDLDTMEARVQGTLRTYATDFEDGQLCAYRATGEPAVEGLVVVAETPAGAREQIAELVDTERPTIEVERAD
ncbi:DUF7854 family protein [Halodesulfurarchaeum sp.]|uniref:DUF7854 family protein n=1 Tax=Halodesulfurarchaeum sp. TaxID=1980530 RepID=UPI001BC1E728|nr:hypothetical protein [Halodesulfurarchaeum sp.]